MTDVSPPPDLLLRLQRALVIGDVAALQQGLFRVLAADAPLPDPGPEPWLELCEAAGLPALARDTASRWLAKDPRDVPTRLRLFDLCMAIDDEPAARALLAEGLRVAPADPRLLALTSTAAGDDPAPGPDPLPLPQDGDVVRFQQLFAGREDVHARQWHDPDRGTGYAPVHEPLSPQLLRNHFLGNVTLGTYLVRRTGLVGLFALDLDQDERALGQRRTDPVALRELGQRLTDECQRLRRELVALGLPPLLEDSGGKGRHLWVFLQEPLEAPLIHELGRALLARLRAALPPGLTLEFFPKQGRVRRDGLGNLIKLPLGVHRRTARRALLLDDAGQPLADPWPALRQVEPVDAAAIRAALTRLGQAPAEAAPTPAPATPGSAPHFARLAWSSAHFTVEPAVATVLEHCSALSGLCQQAQAGRELAWDDQLVMRHTLGHLPSGVAAVNHLLSRQGRHAADALLKSPLRGSPMSCARIAERLGDAACRGCRCDFARTRWSYPTPLLALEGVPIAAELRDPTGPAVLARALHLLRAAEADPDERRAVERALALQLAGAADRTILTAEFRLRLLERDGIDEVELTLLGR